MPGDRRDDFDGLVADPRTGELVYQPSMTKQSFKDQCDINNIVQEFTQHGMVNHHQREGRRRRLRRPSRLQWTIKQALEIARAGQTPSTVLPLKSAPASATIPNASCNSSRTRPTRTKAIALGWLLSKPDRQRRQEYAPPPPPEPPKA